MSGNLAETYTLASNIDCSATSSWNSGAGFVPIGNSSSKFTGSFDGNGHTITGLYINRNSDYQALFGYTSGATISNVVLEDLTISAKSSVGGVVGYASASSIENVSVNGSVSAANTTNSYVGGVVGQLMAGSSITDSKSEASISGVFYAGGLAGNVNNSSIVSSYAKGNVSADDYFGGLAAGTTASTISKSYASGALTCTGTGDDYVGGLVGNVNSGSISNSYATGSILCKGNYDGGLVGKVSGTPTITNTYSMGSVTGASGLGGLIGSGTASVIGSYWDTETSNQTTSSGGIGKTTSAMRTQATFSGWDFSGVWSISAGCYPKLQGLDDDAVCPTTTYITSCSELQAVNTRLYGDYVLANDIDCSSVSYTPIGKASAPFIGTFDGANYDVTGISFSGTGSYRGLFGYTKGATIQNLGLEKFSLTGGDSDYSGSLIGYALNTNVDNCYAAGAFTGDDWIGGLIGYSQDSNVSNSYTKVTIASNGGGNDYMGGLIGYAAATSVTNSYAKGSVKGTGAYIGGLIGYIDTSSSGYGGSSAVINSYSSGPISGGSNTGGLIGYQNGGTVTSSYWNTQTSNQANSAGGVGKTTVEMKKEATFSGWDFSSIWCINEDFTYPGLGNECQFTEIDNCTKLMSANLYTDYKLANDIDCSAVVFTPIGNSTTPYYGNFDGNNHKITGLTINTTSSYQGLFGYVKGSTIKNLTVENYNIKAEDYVGGLIGWSDSAVIDNCAVSGNLSADDWIGGFIGVAQGTVVTNSTASGGVNSTGGENDYAGGLIGKAYDGSIITDCSTTNQVLGTHYLGGLVAQIIDSEISGSSASGTLDAYSGDDAGNYVGGLVGYAENTPIANSYTTGNVYGDSYNGGLAGYFIGSTITDSYTEGNIGESATISAANYVGGLVGYAKNATVTGSHALGQLFSKYYSGGLIGTAQNVAISNSYSEGSVICTQGNTNDAENNKVYVGGLVGKLYEGSSITNSYATGDVEGKIYYFGGLVGYAADSSIVGSHATGQITADDWLGGLVGYATNTPITDSYAEGSILCIHYINCTMDGGCGEDRDYAGGLVGQYINSTIDNSQASGSISCIGFWDGGLVGKTSGATISDCSASGEVNNRSRGGGLIGAAETTTVINSYATGAVNCIGSGNHDTDGCGGLIGRFVSSSSIVDSYATGDVTSGKYYVGGLAGKASGSSIVRSFATGNVSGGAQEIGGLVGYIDSSNTITDSYAIGAVAGGDRVGSLVGKADGSAVITNSYGIGVVTGGSDIGGLVGVKGTASATNSYWDIDSSRLSVSALGAGRTTETMQQESTFSSWDFDNVWCIYENLSYPYLLDDGVCPPAPGVTCTGCAVLENGVCVAGGSCDDEHPNCIVSENHGVCECTTNSCNEGRKCLSSGSCTDCTSTDGCGACGCGTAQKPTGAGSCMTTDTCCPGECNTVTGANSCGYSDDLCPSSACNRTTFACCASSLPYWRNSACKACSTNTGLSGSCMTKGMTCNSIYNCVTCDVDTQCTCDYGDVADGSGNCVTPACSNDSECGLDKCVNSGKHDAFCADCSNYNKVWYQTSCVSCPAGSTYSSGVCICTDGKSWNSSTNTCTNKGISTSSGDLIELKRNSYSANADRYDNIKSRMNRIRSKILEGAGEK